MAKVDIYYDNRISADKNVNYREAPQISQNMEVQTEYDVPKICIRISLNQKDIKRRSSV